MVPDDDEVRYAQVKNKVLNGNIAMMKEKGGRTVRTRIRSTIQAKKEFEEAGRKVRVHLPIPKVYQQVKNVEILASSPEITYVAPEDADQRTVYFETELKEDQEFMVEYSYEYHIDYVELDPAKVEAEQPTFYLEEHYHGYELIHHQLHNH